MLYSLSRKPIRHRAIGPFLARNRLSAFINNMIRRNFTYLEESGGMYYQLSEEIRFTDFEWEFDLMPEDDGDFHQLIAGYGCTLNLRAADDLIFYIDGATNTTTTEKLQRGKFNRVGVKRVSGELTLTINGVGVTRTQDSTPFSVTRAGIREDHGTTSSFTGIFANLKMWNGGDRDTGTLIVDMPMANDLKQSRFEENLAATYSVDHANLLTAEPQWIESNGVYSYNGDGGLSRLATSATDPLKYYVVKFTVSNLSGEGKLYQLESGFRTYTVIDAEGDYTACVWDASGIGFTRNNPGEACSYDLSNVQILENPAGYPLVRTYNMSADEVSEYTYDDANTRWVGEDIIDLSEAGWSIGETWTVLGNNRLESDHKSGLVRHYSLINPAATYLFSGENFGEYIRCTLGFTTSTESLYINSTPGPFSKIMKPVNDTRIEFTAYDAKYINFEAHLCPVLEVA